jgi:hypothetical protein
MVAVALPLLLALILLVVDGANLFVQRRSTQNAADAAAYAAARDLPLDSISGACSGACLTNASDYSVRNAGPALDLCGGDATKSNCIQTPYDGGKCAASPNQCLQVRLTKNVPTFFGGVASLFGGGATTSFDVSARAVTGLSPATIVGNVVPIGMNQTRAPTADPATTACNPAPPPPNCPVPTPPGCRTRFDTIVCFDFDDIGSHGQAILDLSDHSTILPTPGTSCSGGSGGCSAQILKDWIAFGYVNPSTDEPETLPSNAWYADDSGSNQGLRGPGSCSTGLCYARNHGVSLLVPIFNNVDPPTGTPTAYHVIAFAAFKICGTPPPGSTDPVLACAGIPDGITAWNDGGGPGGGNHKLWGQFTKVVAAGAGTGGVGGQDFGVFVVTLFE